MIGLRRLDQRMVDFFDVKLKLNGAYEHAVKQRDARTVFALAMESCVGIREQGGNNKGYLVEGIQETIGGHSGEAWCMAIIQTCIGFSEHVCQTISDVFPSEHCLTVWEKTPKERRVKTFPKRGAVIIWQKGLSTSGHTGMFLEQYQKGRMRCVEGNTEAGKLGNEIVREGGGVYLTERSMKSTPTMKLLGFIKPF